MTYFQGGMSSFSSFLATRSLILKKMSVMAATYDVILADPALMESADHPLFQDIAMWFARSRLLVSGLHPALY